MGKREELIAAAAQVLRISLHLSTERERAAADRAATAALDAILAGLKDTTPEYLRALEAEGVSFATYNRVLQAMLSTLEPKP